jgi:hypothetical protein
VHPLEKLAISGFATTVSMAWLRRHEHVRSGSYERKVRIR